PHFSRLTPASLVVRVVVSVIARGGRRALGRCDEHATVPALDGCRGGRGWVDGRVVGVGDAIHADQGGGWEDRSVVAGGDAGCDVSCLFGKHAGSPEALRRLCQTVRAAADQGEP